MKIESSKADHATAISRRTVREALVKLRRWYRKIREVARKMGGGIEIGLGGNGTCGSCGSCGSCGPCGLYEPPESSGFCWSSQSCQSCQSSQSCGSCGSCGFQGTPLDREELRNFLNENRENELRELAAEVSR